MLAAAEAKAPRRRAPQGVALARRGAPLPVAGQARQRGGLVHAVGERAVARAQVALDAAIGHGVKVPCRVVGFDGGAHGVIGSSCHLATV